MFSLQSKLPTIMTVMTAFVVLFLVFTPFVANAQPIFDKSVVPESCDGIDDAGICGYCDLMTLAQNIIEFLIFFAIIVAILMIVFAGFLYVTSFSSPTRLAKAHNVFRVAIIGLIIVLASWLIIEVILTVLGVQAAMGASPWVLPGC